MTADLVWKHEIVRRFIAVIVGEVERLDPNAHAASRLGKMIMTVKVT